MFGVAQGPLAVGASCRTNPGLQCPAFFRHKPHFHQPQRLIHHQYHTVQMYSKGGEIRHETRLLHPAHSPQHEPMTPNPPLPPSHAAQAPSNAQNKSINTVPPSPTVYSSPPTASASSRDPVTLSSSNLAEVGQQVVETVGGVVNKGIGMVDGLVEGTAKAASKFAQAVDSPQPEVMQLPLPKHLKAIQMRMGSNNLFKISYLPFIHYNPVPETAGQAGMRAIVDPTFDPTRIHLKVDPATIILPDMDRTTAKILWRGKHMRLPRVAKVRMNVNTLQGYVEIATGRADLMMQVDVFIRTPVYNFAPIPISANLTTEEASGLRFRAKGQRLKNGITRTVGITLVPKTNSWIANKVLGLPAEAVLQLEVFLEFFGQATCEARCTQTGPPTID